LFRAVLQTDYKPAEKQLICSAANIENIELFAQKFETRRITNQLLYQLSYAGDCARRTDLVLWEA